MEGILADVLASFDRFEGNRVDDAADVFRTVALHEEYPTFLTITAYTRYLVSPAEVAA